ncbi:MAG: GMC family oxidoreductase, partial [Burkholderiaceae bacterium]
MTQTFDYILVGAGAAGSVLADRLSADGRYTVCVLEAGPKDTNPFIRMPAGYVKMLNDPAMMWQFKSEPSPGSAGRNVYLPQGRVVGGSTSINGLVYNRGQAADVDRWAAMGNEGWSYKDVLPYYQRSESRPQGDPAYRGQVGPIKVSNVDAADPVCDAFIDSVASHGVPAHNDYNGASQRGAGYYQRFIHDTRRVTAASAFLNPALERPNLELRAAHRVLRLLLDGKRVTGVEVSPLSNGQPDGPAQTLTARREVIVCAGTVNSARLL